jgi:hypothetical protein
LDKALPQLTQATTSGHDDVVGEPKKLWFKITFDFETSDKRKAEYKDVAYVLKKDVVTEDILVDRDVKYFGNSNDCDYPIPMEEIDPK